MEGLRFHASQLANRTERKANVGRMTRKEIPHLTKSEVRNDILDEWIWGKGGDSPSVNRLPFPTIKKYIVIPSQPAETAVPAGEVRNLIRRNCNFEYRQAGAPNCPKEQ